MALELVSPTKGAHLITAIGDYGGFVHWDLDKPAPEGASSPPLFGNTSGVACAENKPEVIVRVGVCSHHHRRRQHRLFARWRQDLAAAGHPAADPAFATGPQGGGRGPNTGHIAVSSDGATWVWTPRGSPVVFTTDRGATWTQSRACPTTRASSPTA